MACGGGAQGPGWERWGQSCRRDSWRALCWGHLEHEVCLSLVNQPGLLPEQSRRGPGLRSALHGPRARGHQEGFPRHPQHLHGLARPPLRSQLRSE